MLEKPQGADLSAPQASKHALSIKRTGCSVAIVITCSDEYGAIELYEHLVASAKSGSLKLDLAQAAPDPAGPPQRRAGL